jgi:very-short-patch-repair endonuclease
VAQQADARDANPLESALRAIALSIPGLSVEPQLADELPGFTVHPDLVDPQLGLVIEADGWPAHGSIPGRFARDLQRYTQLVLTGRLVLRYGRDEIVDRPESVRADLVEGVALARLPR